MTPRIIREALFSARGEHRHHASLLLLGSPFRKYLAAALAEQIDAADSWEDPAVPRMQRLLRYLAGPEQEPTLLRWAATADDNSLRDIALTLGHLPPSGADLGVLVARLKGDNAMPDRGILYGLGMRQDRALIALANDQNRPADLRSAASWWLRQGGAVLD